jgi:hypothetical protein
MDQMHHSEHGAPQLASPAGGVFVSTPIWIMVIQIVLFLDSIAILGVAANTVSYTYGYYWTYRHSEMGAPITAVRSPMVSKGVECIMQLLTEPRRW